MFKETKRYKQNKRKLKDVVLHWSESVRNRWSINLLVQMYTPIKMKLHDKTRFHILICNAKSR